MLAQAQQLSFADGRLHFDKIEVNSYLASVLCDFIRRKLLESKISFTFETVMSSRDKVQFLKQAQQAGFRTYLYYVATADPEININRVANRVAAGGHHVPRDKIIERYQRSLDLLFEAVQYANRAYIFDNSGDLLHKNYLQIAEATNGEVLEMQTEDMPIWFKTALWDKFESDAD